MTELGISILVKSEHQKKALSPIEVTELGIFTLVNLELAKALLPIEVTELGISILVKLELAKA